MRRILYVLCIVITLTLLTKPSPAATRDVIIIDLSKSARSVFSQYKSGVRQVLSQIPFSVGDSINVIGITADSFSRPAMLMQEAVHTRLRTAEFELLDCSKFAKGSFQHKSCQATNEERNDAWEYAWRGHFKAERERILSKWETVRIEPYSSSTDVLGALKYVEQIFVTWKGEKRLFIFSDMRHNTRGINLSQASSVDSRLVDDVRRKELLPRLKDVLVIIRGVHAEDKDPAYFESLRQFWERLFHESGANLEEFSIGIFGD